MYNIIHIFSSKHKLHLPSKQLGAVDLFKISIESLELNLYFSTSKNIWIKLFDFSTICEKKKEYDLSNQRNSNINFFIFYVFFWENSSLIHYILQIIYTYHWTAFRFTITIIDFQVGHNIFNYFCIMCVNYFKEIIHTGIIIF